VRVIAVNGSPRKKWNTATLLENALKGAASQGAETRLIHLYDLNYKGCISCFNCKLKAGKSYGQCSVNDDLKQVLRSIEECDALILGSPIYYGMVTGEMRCFLERLMFQYLVYDKSYSSLRKKDIPTGFIYTMNVPQELLEKNQYRVSMGTMESALKRTISGKDVLSLCATDTCQFDDYAKYEVTAFDPAHKAKRRKEDFPKDCRKAFELGERLAKS
jgi:multimeric flavodoxin WrbA